MSGAGPPRDISVIHRISSVLGCVLLVACPLASGQATREMFLVCGSQPNEASVYFSGVLQGPATALQGFHTDFVAFLSQRYGYKGAVGCVPANSAANAQNVLTTRSAALRNQKKNVVETGWTESAPATAATLTLPTALTAKQTGPASATASAAGSAATSGGGGGSDLSSILGAVFGTGAGSGSGAATSGATKSGAGSPASTGGQSGGASQVASALATVFSNKSSGSGVGGAGAPSAPATEGLGSAQTQSTKLVVYGCGRQDTQVACVTQLTNQNQKGTLVQSSAIWQDAFIVDDRGDRHPRSNGFFLNVDGEQRSQLDVSYGKAASFILMFDGVPAKVQKVALRSTAESLDVEDISLAAPSPDPQKH
jgi:hypothetical protein